MAEVRKCMNCDFTGNQGELKSHSISNSHRIPIFLDSQFSSGALRSEKKLPYWMIPSTWTKEIAKRFDIGHEKYGVGNWKKALQTEDIQFVREFYNHAKEHMDGFLSTLLNGPNQENEDVIDHLGAVMWNCGCLITYYIVNKQLVKAAFEDSYKKKSEEYEPFSENSSKNSFEQY